MVDSDFSFLDMPTLAVTVIVGATVLVLVYISSLFRAAAPEETKISAAPSATSKKEKQEKNQLQRPDKTGKKKEHPEKWSNRDSKQFTHPWLLTSLKGHTGQILDMDFSSNGKFLATCADDHPPSDPGGGVPDELPDAVSASSGCSSSSSSSASSSGSEANKENASPKPGGGVRAGLSRRQRKNRSRREDASPPAAAVSSPASTGAAAAARKVRGKARRQAERGTPLRQHVKLNLSDYHLQAFLRHYLLGPEQLLGLGYPVESSLWPGRAIIYKAPGASRMGGDPDPAPPPISSVTNFDVNAREFIPGARCTVLAESNGNSSGPTMSSQTPVRRLEDLPTGMDYNAIGAEWAARHQGGSGSGESQDSPPSPSSSSDVTEEAPEVTSLLMPTAAVFRPASAIAEDQHPLSESQERKCVRCGRGFFVTDDGEYLTQERCVFHWGKLQAAGRGRSEYICCKGRPASRGCAAARLHVWLGVREGVNGPLDGYVRTRARKCPPPDGNYGVYGLDCEMCFTTHGLDLAKVTVVAADGRLVYDCLVKPDNFIVDYNTRFSGITARDFARKGASKSLKEVQNDLMGFINSDTILVGHGLENDLRALRIIHGTVVDTSVVFPHYYGLPYRRSLKSLVCCLLKRDIQKSACGHDSFEDARACVELMLWRVRKDFRGVLGK